MANLAVSPAILAARVSSAERRSKLQVGNGVG
jgi:hypothetical protein